MDNYICIEGRKIQLTPDQLKALGVGRRASLGDYSLSEIVKITRNDEARKYFKIHDVLPFGGFNYELIGINHDKNANDPTAPTITLFAKEIAERRRMHGGACKEGWEGAELRGWLNDTFLKSLPDELVNAIQPTLRISYDAKGKEHRTVDRLFIPSESELFGSSIYSPCMEGERYEAFETSKDRIRVGADGEPCSYWSLSASSGSTSSFVYVNSSGYVDSANASNAFGAPVCFQIS